MTIFSEKEGNSKKTPLRFKWGDAEVRVLGVDELDQEDLAFCAYLSRKNPLWHDGLLVCACSDILDARTIALKFLRENVVIMEQVCFSRMPTYRRAIKVKDSDVLVTTPVIRAYGVFKELAKELKRRLELGELGSS